MKITVHVLFSKPINLSQKLRINDASLLHWETEGKKGSNRRVKRRKLQLWCGCCCCILYTVPNTVKGRLQPSDGLDEGETPIRPVILPSLPYSFFAVSRQKYLANVTVFDSLLAGPVLKQGCFYQVSIRHLSGKVITTERLVVLHPTGLQSGVCTRQVLYKTSH